VSRFLAKRMLVVAAGMALALALGIVALQVGDSQFSRLLGPVVLAWAIPLTVGAAVGLSAWMLLDGTTPDGPDLVHSETVCPACGRTVLKDWRLCPHCGSFIVADSGERDGRDQ
jgi:hypothetical protein